MGNDQKKEQKSSRSGISSKRSSMPISKKLQDDLNLKFEQINRLMEKVMNVPIENSQHRMRLNENYQFVLQFFKDEYQNFKQIKSFMLERKSENIKRIAHSFENLFNKERKDSLPQIFQNSQIKDKITMTERKKLMIFYHIGVLDKYQRTIGGENHHYEQNQKNSNAKILETSEELRKKQRKDLRGIVMNIIKDDAYFVVNPTLQRFNQIMEEAFYKDLKQTLALNDQRGMAEFQQRLINRLTKEEADFIFYCFQLITIVLTQNVQFLLQRILIKYTPEIFSGSSELYESIFCGQIVEKLLFRSKNKALLLAAIQVSYTQTNSMKTLNLEFDDHELAEFLQERTASMQQYTIGPMSFNDGVFNRQSTLNFQPTLAQNISNNQNSNTLNPLDLNRAASSYDQQNGRNSSQGRRKNTSNEKKNIKQNNEIVNLKMLKPYANSRESFIVRNQPIQIRRHAFSNESEDQQQDKLSSTLYSIQEEGVRQGNQYAESIFSEDIQDEQRQQVKQSEIDNNESRIEVKEGIIIEVDDDNQMQRSHLSLQYQLNVHQNNEEEYKEISTQIRSSRKDTNHSEKNSRSSSISKYKPNSNSNNSSQHNLEKQQDVLGHSQSQQSENNKIDQENNIRETVYEKSRDTFYGKQRDTFYGKQRDTFYDKTRDTLHKMRIDRDRGFSQCLKNFLQDKYKEYLNEIFTFLEECLKEKYFFKKIKKAYKFVIKIQDRFAKNSVNYHASSHFIVEKDNWYHIVSMLLKSFLSLRPEVRLELYILCSLINLLHKSDLEGTHLQDLQGLLRDILKLNETTESNLQSQVMTPIQYSEINNYEEMNSELNLKDAQFDFIYNRNSTDADIENKDLNVQSFLPDTQSYMNENSIVKTTQ